MGFTTYGLSEHVPRERVEDLYPEEVEAKTTPTDLHATFRAFTVEARRLRLLYPTITLLIGCETEYIRPSSLSHLHRLLATHDLDYTMGSIHHVDGHPIDYSLRTYEEAERACGGTEELFRRYFDQQFDMISQCRPSVVGHFDLVRMFRGGDDWVLSDEVWERVRRNVDLIVGYGGLVEINSRAWKKDLRDAYPQRDVLTYMIGRGVRFTLSDDSHGPDDVGMHYGRLRAYLEEMGVDAVWRPVVGGGVEKVDGILTDPFWNQFR
ncbi:histidinolphosphatase [Thoreauomyces humboldtii]|nr:histidinolphosphatase [Thoreauomyces humboldtii]